MDTEKIENNDPNDLIDPIGDLRRSLNQTYQSFLSLLKKDKISNGTNTRDKCKD